MITDFRIWCDNQTVDMNGKVRCLAHFVEGRVLFCPYSDNADRLRSKHSCSDYRPDSRKEVGLE